MKKIALIDDYPVILESYTEALSPLYKCVTHTDPVDALNDPNTLDADAIFVDYTMPGMSGEDAYNQLKVRNKLGRVAIITASVPGAITAIAPSATVFYKHDSDLLEKMVGFIEMIKGV